MKMSNKLTLTGRRNKNVIVYRKRSLGRNCHGRITSGHKGGGHKRLIRIIDFKRNKLDIPAIVKSIEYDPNRNANIAMLNYLDGEKRYIVSLDKIKVGDKLISTNKSIKNYKTGNSFKVKEIPVNTSVNSLELRPKNGGKVARSAGSFVQILNSSEKGLTKIKMPSGELRYVNPECRATIGRISNKEYKNCKLGKAGRSRWLGIRPKVRGVAMNPVDHPQGGGEGKTSGGGHPVNKWGQLSKGFFTRNKKKSSNKMILKRRNKI